MQEIWKDVVGHEGLYLVSNLGNVKTLLTRKKLLKPAYDKDGYLRVALTTKDNKRKNYYVHRLVLSAFVPNTENKPCVNHIDGIRDNNKLENLEWCTFSENEKHKYKLGYKQKISKERIEKLVELTSKKVKCIETGIIYKSMHEADRQTGICYKYISACCTGRRKKAKGYHWQYV